MRRSRRAVVPDPFRDAPSRLALGDGAVLAEGAHPVLGRQRINLTFRRAL